MTRLDPAPATEEPEATIDKPPQVKSVGTPGVDPRVATEPALSDDEKKVQKQNEKSADLLSGAAASGDPEVQQLLAHRQIAEMNADEASIKEIDAKLKKLTEL